MSPVLLIVMSLLSIVFWRQLIALVVAGALLLMVLGLAFIAGGSISNKTAEQLHVPVTAVEAEWRS